MEQDKNEQIELIESNIKDMTYEVTGVVGRCDIASGADYIGPTTTEIGGTTTKGNSFIGKIIPSPYMTRPFVKIHVINKSKNELPEYETLGAACFDISASLEEPIILKPGDRALVPTGLYMEIEHGFEVQLRARSGLAVKHGISLVNGIGTIDEDYRGEVKVILINHGKDDFIINNGDRIAQGAVQKVLYAMFLKTDILSSTDRGDQGFGHTGV